MLLHCDSRVFIKSEFILPIFVPEISYTQITPIFEIRLSFLEPNNLRLCAKEFLLTTLSNKLFMVTIVSYQTCLMNFDKDLKEKEQKN